MRHFRLIFLFLFMVFYAQAQQRTENVILITLDGYRWQELFRGADSALLFRNEFVKDKHVREKFYTNFSDRTERRAALMPFVWDVISKQGQLYGNRDVGNTMKCANPHWFSYPGYSELFTGFVDRAVKSNDRVMHPHATIFEVLNQRDEFRNRIAAFATWDVFPFILREPISGINTNAGNEPLEGVLSEREELLNELQEILPNPHTGRFDAMTFMYAFEYLKRMRPRVMYIGFDETDDHGHKGKYDEYLKSANKTDEMIRRLWNWVQQDEQYRDKTTLIITTDHGRGKGIRKGWRKHGRLYFGSGHIWMAVMGPDTPPTGVIHAENTIYQKQIAPSIAALLGVEYSHPSREIGDVIHLLFSEPAHALKASAPGDLPR